MIRRRVASLMRAAPPPPEIVFLGAAATDTNNSLPSLPSVEGGVLATDFLLAIFHMQSASTPNFSGEAAITPPTGWTGILEVVRSNVLLLYAAWAPGDANLGGTGWTKGNLQTSRSILRVYRNVDLSDPIGDFDSLGTSNAASQSVPALTLEGSAGSWLVGAHAVRAAGQPPAVFGSNVKRVFDADTAENLTTSDTGAATTDGSASGAAFAPGGNRILAKIELKRAA